jgi:hypothetical protein
MKAQLIESMRLGDWIYEIKFDGYRALALRGGGQTRILSRNEKDLGKKFPEIVASIAALDIQDAIIDGEMSRWMIRVVYPSKHSKGSTWAGSGCRSFSTPLTLLPTPAQWKGPSRLTDRRPEGEAEGGLKKAVRHNSFFALVYKTHSRTFGSSSRTRPRGFDWRIHRTRRSSEIFRSASRRLSRR